MKLFTYILATAAPLILVSSAYFFGIPHSYISYIIAAGINLIIFLIYLKDIGDTTNALYKEGSEDILETFDGDSYLQGMLRELRVALYVLILAGVGSIFFFPCIMFVLAASVVMMGVAADVQRYLVAVYQD